MIIFKRHLLVKSYMKKIVLIMSIAFALITSSCSKSDNNTSCNFLLNVAVSTSINLNLPQYSQLEFISQAVYVPNVGNKGIIVMNSGTGFVAWDAADPNHGLNDCPRLEIVGAEAVSSCGEDISYSLFTGQPLGENNLPCGLKFYPVEQAGNMLFISN